MIPFRTDAPIYHLPIATMLLIFANMVCFALHGPIDEGHAWVLEFGTMPNPLEWLSSMFAHLGVVHLVGNIYFLGVFGLIVEGKLGIRRFLMLYLFLGLTSAALTQLLMWPSSGGGAVGASCAIMGLMAVCLVWAPKNELTVFMILPSFFIARGYVFEISILAYGVIYILWELLGLLIANFEMSTPALHLIGFSVGIAAGSVFVKKQWVDCENWDLFAVMAGTHGRYGDASTTVGSHADASRLFGKDVDVSGVAIPQESSASGNGELTEVNELIDDGMFFEAAGELLSLQLGEITEELTEARLRRLAIGLHDADAVDEAQMFLEEYEERFRERADWCRVRLAHILLHRRKKPSAALRRMKLVRLSRLSENQQQRARKIVAAAKQRVQAGVRDASDELDWDH